MCHRLIAGGGGEGRRRGGGGAQTLNRYQYQIRNAAELRHRSSHFMYDDILSKLTITQRFNNVFNLSSMKIQISIREYT